MTACRWTPSPFFRSKRAAAVLKHAILADYVVPFASKTGSASIDNRVIIVDGYAGAGRYDDGEAGSPALIAEAARRLGRRAIECFFVEKDRQTFKRLREVLADVDGGGKVTWEARQGTVEGHLDDLLKRAEGVPLFLFLDPFGLGLPFDVIANVFANRPRGVYTPATEVLFRFDASAIRRIRGVLHAKKDFPARAKQLEALDRAAGGIWWRNEDDQSLDNEQYVNWFMKRLLKEVCTRAGCTGWITDVKQREGLQPAYYLVFLTRHRDGMEVFAETVSLAQEKWRRAIFDEAVAAMQASGQAMLWDPEESFAHDEKQLAEQWHDRLERNVRALLRQHHSFIVWDKLADVFQGVLGVAREKHLRVALKRLHAAGVTSSDSRGSLYGKRVVRAANAQL